MASATPVTQVRQESAVALLLVPAEPAPPPRLTPCLRWLALDGAKKLWLALLVDVSPLVREGWPTTLSHTWDGLNTQYRAALALVNMLTAPSTVPRACFTPFGNRGCPTQEQCCVTARKHSGSNSFCIGIGGPNNAPWNRRQEP